MAAKSKKKKAGGSEYVVDMSGYDPEEERAGGGYDGDEPKKGVYEGELVTFNEHTSGEGNEGLRWGFRITEEPYQGWFSYVYSNLEGAEWKTKQIVHAISGIDDRDVKLVPAPEGEDGAESPTVQKARPVKLQVRREKSQSGDDEWYGRIRTVLPGSGKKKGKKKSKSDDPF